MDKRIDDNTFRVGISPNGYTSRETVYRYFLRRCAELTSAAGYDYFVIQDYDDFVLIQKYDRDCTGGFERKPLVGIIKCFAGKMPSNTPGAFEAKVVLGNK